MSESTVTQIAHLARAERRRKQRELRCQRKKQGLHYPPTMTLPNRKSSWQTVKEEKAAIQHTTEEKLKVYGQLLPGLLQKLGRIPDPRNPKKTKHRMAVVMLYGILMFVFQMSSRRETNQDMTTPQLLEHLQTFFPELADMPHQDTLCRVLAVIDVQQIEEHYHDLLHTCIRKKKFCNLLTGKRYLVAVDGTQKYVMDQCWDERYLRRRIANKPGEEPTYQYYAYVLEAVLVLSNGMVLPLTSIFLENTPELEAIESDKEWKQDCELKAFHRLATKVKRLFPKLPMTYLLDGLYANGPVMDMCRRNKWQFMIVLKDESLSTVWKEVNGMMRLDTEREYAHGRQWQGREQEFRWVNGIEYEYRKDGKRKVMPIHVVTCKETWEEIDRKTNAVVTKTASHAWISSDPIDKKNVHARCNLTARKRWLQENNILKEKHQGYQYEHIFSHDWNAMRGYHYLMHIARMLNEAALHSISLCEHVREVGIQAFIKKFREAMTCRELNQDRLRRLAKSPGQLRFVQDEDWKINRVAV